MDVVDLILTMWRGVEVGVITVEWMKGLLVNLSGRFPVVLRPGSLYWSSEEPNANPE